MIKIANSNQSKEKELEIEQLKMALENTEKAPSLSDQQLDEAKITIKAQETKISQLDENLESAK